MDIREALALCIKGVRAKRTLIHHITNYVTVNDCANVVLAIGANPVMADDPKEVEEMVGIANALVINIGTLSERTVGSMLKAGKKANAMGIPVVLDPVGVGATPFRFESVQALLEGVRFSVIRGNMAEIKVIAGLHTKRSGVDSLEDESDAKSVALHVAQTLGCVVAITGKEDVISDGARSYILSNGDSALTRLTGTGCMSSSLIGSMLGAGASPLVSAIAGIGVMGIAGEIASSAKGLGSFKVALMDAISLMEEKRFLERLKIETIK